MTYTFTGAVAYDRLGSSWRTAAGLRSVSVTDPATGLLPTNLVQGGVSVTWLTADANSRYSFTCDVPGVVVDFGAGAQALYANEVPGMAIAAGGATNTAIDARMKWAPSTAYTLGQQILSPNNDVVSALVAHTSGATYTAANWRLSSTYAAFGLPGDGVIYVSTGAKASDANDGLSWGKAKATISAAVTALGSGAGTVMIGAGTHTVAAPLPNTGGITYRGAGRYATTLSLTTSLLTPATVDLSYLVFEGLTINGNAGHIFDLTTHGLHHCTFRDCTLSALGTAKSIVYLRGMALFQENSFYGCWLQRAGTSTVPAFDIIDSASGCNGNLWMHCLAHSNNATVSPFWRLEATANYLYDNTWLNITGEQNRGGLIHLYSPMNCVIQSVNDYDAVGAYMDHLTLHSRTTGGYPNNNRVSGVGPNGSTMTAGKQHFAALATSNGLVVERVHDALGASLVTISNTYGHIVTMSGLVVPGLYVSTTSVGVGQAVCIYNGASLTATLPDPTLTISGTQNKVKNINASALTVVSAGTSKTIDGAASQSLAQWAKATYVTDGAQWYVVG